MIITNLIGGLGNQMFQYACGRSLALELQLPLKVAIDMFAGYTLHHGPELRRVFSVDPDVARPADLRRTIGTLFAAPVARRILGHPALARFRGRRFIVEPHFRYWEKLREKARTGGYLQGYWQSERYFAAHATTIRRDFSFKQPLTERNAELARIVLDSAAVSLHVRRADYVSNAKTASVHGTCTQEYYFNAIDALRQRVPHARLFAFSDDPQWVKQVLEPRHPNLELVAHNRGEHSYNDMRLMSMCRHHIIANSSFSWWGAWLNPNPDKIVIAPRQWFANGTDTVDLLPPTWERL